MQPLPESFDRCYGQECNKTQTCRRYLTMRIDPPQPLPYVTTKIDERGECESYIPLYQRCPTCEE